MDISEIKRIQTDPQIPVAILNAYNYESYIVINNYVAIPVFEVSHSIDNSNPIPITLNGYVKGYLIFTKIGSPIEINLMSELEFISYLTDAASNHYYTNDYYNFGSNFLLINEDFLIDYISDHKETSSIWGNFLHESFTISRPPTYKKTLTKIEIGHELKQLNTYSHESSFRAIEQPYAFERFLKFYHLLELQFDYFLIEKINRLTIPQDSNKIGSLLNSYSDKEIPRLTEIIKNYCTDIGALESKLSFIKQFEHIAEEMFIKFGKSSSALHLTDLDKFRAVVSTGSFSNADFNLLKVPGNKDHDNLIINITAYWIYRIRCSIAHNKIGEYLLSWTDENFIVEFGEPLLQEVLMQCFKKIV